jgi:hypothetical protein
MKIEQLIREQLIKLSEQKESPNYMFFSNLEQMIRQCNMLLELDQNRIDELLLNGHDWAADHVTVAKENMDQVFDFIMGEFKGSGSNEEEISEMKNDPCWRGYEMVGKKMKNGKEVPNCVPKK